MCALLPSGGFFSSADQFHVVDASTAEDRTVISKCRPGFWSVYGVFPRKSDNMNFSNAVGMVVLNLDAVMQGVGGPKEPGTEVDMGYVDRQCWMPEGGCVIDVGSGVVAVCEADSVKRFRTTEQTSSFLWFTSVGRLIMKEEISVTGDVPGPLGAVWNFSKTGGDGKTPHVCVNTSSDPSTSEVWAIRIVIHY